MSKRSRTEFESTSATAKSTEDRTKRRRSNSATVKADHSDIECSVCWDEFSEAIYQCIEGHLLCHECRPKFDKCPTCNVSLQQNIRNRILERILSTGSKSSSAVVSAPNAASVSRVYCSLCRSMFACEQEREQHYMTCQYRKIKCPFMECVWTGCFHEFSLHAQQSHFTSHGTVNKASTKNTYSFNHAIKLPPNTLNRTNADFLWPKIVAFADGKEFFIMSRFKDGYITVFVRLMALSKLGRRDLATMERITLSNTKELVNMSNGRDDVLGQYWIELRVKESDKERDRVRTDKSKSEHYNSTPLRWPGNLCGITVPFDQEKSQTQVLSVHQSIFTKYWTQPNPHSSAVLRFQFRVVVQDS